MTTATLQRPPADTVPKLRAGRLIGAVARSHARQTLRSAATWLGLLLSSSLLYVLARDASGLPELARFSTFIGLGSAPLAAAALLVGHHIVSRPHRDGTDVLFEATAAKPSARTAGHLLGGLSAVVPGVILAAGWVVALVGSGTTGTLDVAELAVGPLVVLLASTVGVATATWAPQRFVGLVALGVFASVQIVLHDIPLGTAHWLGWWQTVTWHTGADLWIRPSGLHLLYLLGVTGVMAWLGLARHGLNVRRALAGVAAVAVMLSAGVAQLPYPTDEQVAAVWDRIEHPEDHWECEQLDTVEVCLFPMYAGWRTELADTVNRTLQPVPADQRPAVRIVQHQHGFPSQLLNEFGESHPRTPELRNRGHALLDQPAGEDRGDGEPIRIGVARWETAFNHGFDVAIAAAKRAVGLPTATTTERVEVDEETYQQLLMHNGSESERGQVLDAVELDGGGAIVPITRACRPTGQARETVAFWLAARSSPERTELIRTVGQGFSQLSHQDGVIRLEDGRVIPSYPYVDNYLHTSDAAVQWTAEAVYLAAQLLDRDGVGDRLADDWQRWTTPSTSNHELIELFDLQPYPTPAQLVRNAGLNPAEFPDYGDTWPDPHAGPPLATNPVCP